MQSDSSRYQGRSIRFELSAVYIVAFSLLLLALFDANRILQSSEEQSERQLCGAYG